MTTHSEALDLVYGALASAMASATAITGGPVPVIYEGAPNNPKAPKRGFWAMAAVRGVIGRQTTLGSPQIGQHDYEQVNMLFVQLFVSKTEGYGMDDLRQLAQIVRSAYRSIAAGQVVWFRDATIREQPPETDWYSINVTVEYSHTETE